MLIWAYAISFAAALITLSNWRNGLTAVLVIGILQDPFRKLTEGTPTYYTVWAAAVFFAILLLLVVRRQLPRFEYLALDDRVLLKAWQLFVLLVLLQSVHALVRMGSPVPPALGMMFYLGPIATVLFSMLYFRDSSAVRRFMFTYVVLAGPAALTVYLSPEYADRWSILRDIGSFSGTELIIYDQGAVLKSYSGIFRVGEIAAWHAATAAAFLLILTSDSRAGLVTQVITGLLIVALIGAIVLTGRRKMLLALTAFVLMQWVLLAWYLKSGNRSLLLVLLLALFGSYGLGWFEGKAEQSAYLARGQSVFGDALERGELAFAMFANAIWRSYGLGLGAGVTAQGVQHFGGVSSAAGGSAEAGGGKIVIELGLAGLLLVLVLLERLRARVLRVVRIMRRAMPGETYLLLSMLALLFANLVTFVVATQLFGDPFVLVMIGLMLGIVFAIMHRFLYLLRMHRERQIAERERLLASEMIA